MRVIAGRLKGIRLNPPSHITARPTTDFAKENLFNILTNRLDFERCVALDLFAGTGSIAFEFVSRGSQQVTAVEKARTQQLFIDIVRKKYNMQSLRLVRMDVFAFLKICTEQYDCIFADPPYQLETLSTIPSIIFEKNILKPDGIFILEHSKNHDFSASPHFVEQRAYGSVHFSFFS